MVAGVILGFVTGSLLSFVAYWLGLNALCLLPVAVLPIKVFVGRHLRHDERTRGVAIGVLLSIATGTLIFFGLCANQISIH